MKLAAIAFFVITAATATIACAAASDGSAAGVIAGRQAAFRLSGPLVGSIKAAVDRGDDVTTQSSAAAALAKWGQALPGMFPAGSGDASSRALPAVWSDRAGFEKAAANYADAAAKLSALGKAGDKAGFATQFAALRKTCGDCHDHYRQPEERH